MARGARLADLPRIVQEDADYLVAWKPHGMPSAPLHAGDAGTLLEWVVQRYPEVGSVRGHKDREGGLLHRLDTPTAGVVLLARNQVAWDAARHAAEYGTFRKAYRASCADVRGFSRDYPDSVGPSASGTPGTRGASRTVWESGTGWPFLATGPRLEPGQSLISGFRAWGPGRQRVAPVEAGAPVYRSEVRAIEVGPKDSPRGMPTVRVEVGLVRGFRHQVRAHLAWCGYPILGDSLYDGSPVVRHAPTPAWIGLVAHSLEIRLPDRTLSVAVP